MERQESALNMSKKTKQVKVMVVSLGVIIWSSICGGMGKKILFCRYQELKRIFFSKRKNLLCTGSGMYASFH